MGENTGIAYATHSFNPWIGCTKVSPGCINCYARAWDARFDPAHVAPHWGPGAPRRRTRPQNWSKVRRWQRDRRAAIDRGENPEPVRVFCASLADVFDNEVDPFWRVDLWRLVEECPDLDWILVTKRIGNVALMAPADDFGPNVIVTATIVNQSEADRDVPKLVALKASGVAKHIGVSYEPALGPVDWSRWVSEFDWLIIGGESNQPEGEAREFRMIWAAMSILQCRCARTPVFMKQTGSMARGDTGFLDLKDPAGADPTEWPGAYRIREYPRFGSEA
jgi:protein gp37